MVRGAPILTRTDRRPAVPERRAGAALPSTYPRVLTVASQTASAFCAVRSQDVLRVDRDVRPVQGYVVDSGRMAVVSDINDDADGVAGRYRGAGDGQGCQAPVPDAAEVVERTIVEPRCSRMRRVIGRLGGAWIQAEAR